MKKFITQPSISCNTYISTSAIRTYGVFATNNIDSEGVIVGTYGGVCRHFKNTLCFDETYNTNVILSSERQDKENR